MAITTADRHHLLRRVHRPHERQLRRADHDPYVFGWGAGIFFLGYFLFEVPSNVILEKVGGCVWR